MTFIPKDKRTLLLHEEKGKKKSFLSENPRKSLGLEIKDKEHTGNFYFSCTENFSSMEEIVILLRGK